jgi:hypothetical protein
MMYADIEGIGHILSNERPPKLEYAGNPPSGKENRRTRRMFELRKRKGRL